jgi:hypothetical protein
MLTAMEHGKSVVTPNKAAVAAGFEKLLETARANNVTFRYEASVGGGIPIIRPLKQCLAANEISEIYVGDFRNVLLHTRTGYIVHIGSPEENLMAKIAVTRAVAAKLQERGKEGGSIDVTDVSQPIYSP